LVDHSGDFELARGDFMLQSSAAMPPESDAPSDEQAFAAERRRIERFYNEDFLPTNAWTALTPRAYLYLRQRQRRIRDTLLACGFDAPDKLRSLKVLDVGSGGGTNLAWLVELGVNAENCVGIDLLPKRVEAAQQRMPNMRWIHGDITSTDVGGPFDFVMLVAVLTSVTYGPMKQQIVDRCFSMLKPGGVLFFYDVMCLREHKGFKDYKMLMYPEMEQYFRGRKVHWFRRDLLKMPHAERLTERYGITLAESVQALGFFNMEASFAYVRV
jgi:2-polyprenyl-3-methyl-5-hydroxy-6-metoxy-1,4-benzoquinol methylase